MKKYLHVISIGLQSNLAYRFNYLTRTLFSFIPLFAMLSLWRTIYQNHGAGASGYYQIIPGTWRLFGGTGPAAYLAPKAEQDAVAARIWNGGAGASNWVCAGIVGIH